MGTAALSYSSLVLEWRREGFAQMTLDIPNYRIVEKLGTGASSRIFRARSMRSGKDYAVKVVKVNSPEDNTIIELMKAEHTIGSAIDHPVLRKVYELRLIRQRLRVRGALLFMEYVDGVTMGDREFERPLEEIVPMFMKVAEGLHAMHQAGFVHADLKPTNIIVTPDEQVKLIDFGQSHTINEAKARIQGTVDFMAPEQVQKKVLDARTDVFGFGATIYRAVTGRSVPTEMNQTVNMAAPILRRLEQDEESDDVDRDLPISLKRLITDCCATEPSDRPRDMMAVHNRLSLVHSSLTRDFDYDDDEYDLEDSILMGDEFDPFSDSSEGLDNE